MQICNANHLGKYESDSVPEAVHTKTVVKSGAVGHEGGQASLEDETEIERPIAHPLLDE